MKRGPGRPTLPAHERVERAGWKRLSVLVRPDEAEAIQAAADADDRALSAWCRRALMRAARPTH